MSRFAALLGLLVTLTAATWAEAGYPILSHFTRRADGPYAPSMGRYLVVDPVPVAGPHGAAHGHTTIDPDLLWERRDLNRPSYPYGWFGVPTHTTQRWTNGGYYDNYVEGRTLRGR